MENITARKIAECALNRIFGFEPRIGHSLVEYAGSPEEVFRLDRDTIRDAMGPYWKFISQICPAALESAERELERLARDEIVFIGSEEEGYPELLRECEDRPIGLYLKSEDSAGNIFGRRPAIAIVGTRDMTPYGEEWCRDFVECLARTTSRPVIISGLAFGVDITAHRAALDHGLPTVAVMATGIDKVYPRNHIHTADRMVSTDGCALLTDYPPGTSPLPIHFMRRNRIIAGLADQVVLVESRVKGGGMMTARLAHSYNRDVFALPGRIDDARSQGCNMLIREKVAEPAGEAGDLVRMMGLGDGSSTKRRGPESILAERYPEAIGKTMEEMVSIVRAIIRNRGIDIEGIRNVTGLPYSTVAGVTELLCADGIIGMDLLGRCRFL